MARNRGEPCPLSDEPFHETDDVVYPGFLSASKNPNGLCMPCCFRKNHVQGSKVYERNMDCEENGTDKAAQAPQWNTVGHLSRADRILDAGDTGTLPDAFRHKHFAKFARRGMGTATTFFDCLKFLTHRQKIREQFSDSMKYQDFILGHHSRRPKNLHVAQLKKWWNSEESGEYRRIFRLPTRLSKKQYNRELVGYSVFHERDVSINAGHEEWLASFNAWAPIDAPHVVVMEVDNESANHGMGPGITIGGVKSGRKEFCILLKRGDRYEPVGEVVQRTLRERISLSHSIASVVLRKSNAIDIINNGVIKIVDAKFLVVGIYHEKWDACALFDVYAINTSFEHIHASDLPKGVRVSNDLASRLFQLTCSNFYKEDYAKATMNLLADAQLDMEIWIEKKMPDRRTDILDDIVMKADAEMKHAQFIWETVKDDPVLKGDKSSAEKITRLRTTHLSKLPKIPLHVMDYILERLIRPIPVNVLPIIQTKDDEILIF